MSLEPVGRSGVAGADAPRPQRLWDLSVRLVHWLLVLLLPALWWTWRFDQISVHKWLGCVTLGLLVFRIYWGFAGSEPARFARFVVGPRALLVYVRRLGASGPSRPGHNPLGGWSVLLLLGLLSAQVVLGLVIQDVDGVEAGPLAHLVSYETAEAARAGHALIFNLLLGAVGLHLCAVFYYLIFRRDNLIGPMMTGRKRLAAPLAESVSHRPWRAIGGGAAAAALALWIGLGCPAPPNLG